MAGQVMGRLYFQEWPLFCGLPIRYQAATWPAFGKSCFLPAVASVSPGSIILDYDRAFAISLVA